jgi:hypothetical protein
MRLKWKSWLGLVASGAAVLGVSAPAQAAVDGCQVMLCMAGNWRNISECTPMVEEALRESAWHPWPTCNMQDSNGNVSSANFAWATEQTCPPFYSNYNPDNMAWQSCTYPGVVTVTVGGSWWADVFVNFGGTTSTHYSDNAKAQLGPGNFDPTYDNDAANYVPPAPYDPNANPGT